LRDDVIGARRSRVEYFWTGQTVMIVYNIIQQCAKVSRFTAKPDKCKAREGRE